MDTKVNQLLKQEEKRQEETITLIPSENYASRAVRELVGSVFMNKYSEGYSGRRYYQGNKNVDEVENLAIERAKEIFEVPHANVQPYSGSPANSVVLFALMEPGDIIMGLELSSGGHLTHGHPKITFSGRYFKSVQFGVKPVNSLQQFDTVHVKQNDIEGQALLDYDAIEALAVDSRPKVMLIGTTAFPFILDWQRFGEIAKKAGTYLVADISHVAGLIVGGVYPSPVPWAHVVTTTTHKTLRGPRGAIVMVTNKGLEKNPDLGSLIDRAVFPGMQGGPHDNTTAAIAQCLAEASTADFRRYSEKIIDNAQILADELKKGGLSLIGGGTECHLMLVALQPIELSGNVVAEALEVSGIVVNRNTIPGDTLPFYPTGIRLGTPAVTTRGMTDAEMRQIAAWILKVIEHVKGEKLSDSPDERKKFLKEFKDRIWQDKYLLDIADEVKQLCLRYPIP